MTKKKKILSQPLDDNDQQTNTLIRHLRTVVALPVPDRAATAAGISIASKAPDAIQVRVDTPQLALFTPALPVATTTADRDSLIAIVVLLVAGSRHVDVGSPHAGLKGRFSRAGNGNGCGLAGEEGGEAEDGAEDGG